MHFTIESLGSLGFRLVKLVQVQNSPLAVELACSRSVLALTRLQDSGNERRKIQLNRNARTGYLQGSLS